MGDAVKQQRSDLRLQILDLLAEWRLPDPNLSSGPREVPFLAVALFHANCGQAPNRFFCPWRVSRSSSVLAGLVARLGCIRSVSGT
jgi:hypothetical protein